MNPKAKTEWRRSGERAGASTSPAQATGLPRASCRSLPLPPGSASGGSALSPPSRGLPFLREALRPSCSRRGPFSALAHSWKQEPWAGRLGLQIPTHRPAHLSVPQLLLSVQSVNCSGLLSTRSPSLPDPPPIREKHGTVTLLSPARAWLLLPASALPERRRSQNCPRCSPPSASPSQV